MQKYKSIQYGSIEIQNISFDLRLTYKKWDSHMQAVGM